MGIITRLRKAIRGAAREPASAPLHLKNAPLQEPDSLDMHPPAGHEPEPVLDGLRLEIVYEDVDGRRTNRVVTCKRIVHAEDGDRLLGFCHGRCTDRTFLLDRIVDAANHSNGRRIADLGSFLAPFMEQAGELSNDHGTTRQVLVELGDELRILAFMAKADDALHRQEDDLTSIFVRRRAESLGHEIAGNYDHDRVMEWFRHQVPDMEVVERAVGRIAKRSETQLGHIWELAAQVMEADGKVLPEELDRLHALAQAIDQALSELRAAARQ